MIKNIVIIVSLLVLSGCLEDNMEEKCLKVCKEFRSIQGSKYPSGYLNTECLDKCVELMQTCK